jgi:hypothetical protein
MNFLNSIILFGLGAAVLPLLIHLLSKRNTKETVFPSIRLLELLKSDRIKLLRIKQILILLLRTLILILIILAFARPALKSVFKADSRTTAVIIVDDSAGMMYVDNGEMLYDRALRKAGEILNFLREGDTAAVIFTGDNRPDTIPRVYSDPGQLDSVLKDTERLHASADPTASFARAVELLGSSGAINKELYYITDNASNSLPDSIAAADDSIRLYIVSLGPEKRNGTVIGDISLIDKLIAPGKKLTFSVTSIGDSRGNAGGIEFFVNGERKGKFTADALHEDAEISGPGQKGRAEFSYVPETAGWYSVHAAVNDGYFEPGETRRIIVNVPEIVSILIAGGSREDIFFLEKALMSGSDESIFEIRSVLEDDLPDIGQEDLVWADVIILSGVKDMPKSQYLPLLDEIVEHGKGVMVFPGSDVGAPLYSDGIFRDIFPAEIVRRSEGNDAAEKKSRIDTFDLDHPVLSGISREGGFVKPESRSSIRMIPSPDIDILARFDDGTVASGVTGCGKGTALVFAVSANPRDGDFPLSGIFSPLVIRAAQYLSGTLYDSRVYEAGESVSENVGEVIGNTQVTVKPDGLPSVLVEVDTAADGAEISTGAFTQPGFYSVFAGTNERARFCVNTPYSEIVYARAGEIKMSESYENISWKHIADTQNIADVVTNDRYGKELYAMFMIWAILLLCVEMAVSRKV